MNYKIVVNKDNPYNKNDFSNIELKKIKNSSDEEYLLEKRTLKAFLNLKEDLKKDNIYIDLASAYRTYEEQERIIDKLNELYGKDYTIKYAAKVGESEHHTGLAFDIYLIINNKKVLTNDDLLKHDDIFKKIIKLLPNYGLILRYPKGKEKITCYNYEPWHYRYVGKTTAKIIMNNNLTLEEYNNLYNKSGIILVNKPKGLTSRDVVNRLGDIFDTKKIGHNGTLDPLAEGLLVVTINKATKINELLTSVFKEYIAEVKVGIGTDTLDLEGKVEKTSNKRITKEMLDNLFKNFPKRYLQEVPVYSAIKVNGKKLYQYARNNEKIDLPKREVTIKELELLDYKDDYFKFRCIVSKGTYIRSLIKDMGKYLDIPCVMSSLLRTRQGKFSLDKALKLEDININSPLITIKDALDIDIVEISDDIYKKVINGAIINNNYHIKDKVLFTKNSSELAIYKVDNDKLRCYKTLK
mgnify:CR=1 FL=1